MAKITEITLTELPYTNLMGLKKIYESTLLWFAGDIKQAEALKD